MLRWLRVTSAEFLQLLLETTVLPPLPSLPFSCTGNLRALSFRILNRKQALNSVVLCLDFLQILLTTGNKEQARVRTSK